MLEIQKTVVECVSDSELKPMKKGGSLLKGFVKNVTSGYATFIPFVVFDPELAEKLAPKAMKGKRLTIEEAVVKSRRYDTDAGPRNAYELIVTKAKAARS